MGFLFVRIVVKYKLKEKPFIQGPFEDLPIRA
jgi:hypothetical protein